MNTQKNKKLVETIVLGGVLAAIVFVLQMFGAVIRFGPFSISLVLIPIVIGAATCGYWVSALLGLVFGFAVLMSGDAAAFMVVNPMGTVATVLLKGALAGFLSGLTFKGVLALLDKRSKKQIDNMLKQGILCANCENGVFRFISRHNKYIAVFAAAIVCPLVNTGIFLLGCLVFFLDTVSGWAQAAGLGGGVGHYMIFGLVGVNFLFELGLNIVLSPTVVRLLNIKKRIEK